MRMSWHTLCSSGGRAVIPVLIRTSGKSLVKQVGANERKDVLPRRMQARTDPTYQHSPPKMLIILARNKKFTTFGVPKKLLYLLACMAVGSMVFTSCDSRSEDSRDPWAAGYKPESTNLITSGDLIGQMCTMDGRVTTQNAEADGIIFALSPNRDSAYLCAFTDIMTGESGRFGWTWTPNTTIAWASRTGSAIADSVPIGTDKLMGGDVR